jgi:hypothetical protein
MILNKRMTVLWSQPPLGSPLHCQIVYLRLPLIGYLDSQVSWVSTHKTCLPSWRQNSEVQPPVLRQLANIPPSWETMQKWGPSRTTVIANQWIACLYKEKSNFPCMFVSVISLFHLLVADAFSCIVTTVYFPLRLASSVRLLRVYFKWRRNPSNLDWQEHASTQCYKEVNVVRRSLYSGSTVSPLSHLSVRRRSQLSVSRTRRNTAKCQRLCHG